MASANGLLLGCYLVPAWSVVVWKIVTAPVRGLFDVANLGPAIFASDILRLMPVDMLRFAYLVALAKFTVIAFFIAAACFTLSSQPHEQEEGDELLHVALALASIVSTASMALAWWFGEGDALRLHATETLMILSAAIVAVIDLPAPRNVENGGADFVDRLAQATQPDAAQAPAAL
jgi:hypothetical protein